MVGATDCRRCGEPLSGEYCAACGQRRSEPLRLPRLWRETLTKLVELDLRYPRTMVAMISRPGFIIREYLEGNRATWFNPAKFVFINASIYLLILSFVLPPEDLVLGVMPDADRTTTLFAFGLIIYIAYFYTLVAAVAARWLFRTDLASVAESYVLMLYTYGAGILVNGLVTVLDVHLHLFEQNQTRVVMLIYICYVFLRFSSERWWITLPKAVIVYLVYSVTALSMVRGIVEIYLRARGI